MCRDTETDNPGPLRPYLSVETSLAGEATGSWLAKHQEKCLSRDVNDTRTSPSSFLLLTALRNNCEVAVHAVGGASVASLHLSLSLSRLVSGVREWIRWTNFTVSIASC
jgi:hypothetical protein